MTKAETPLDTWARVMSSAGGRDKFNKFIQGTGRFLAYRYLSKDAADPTGKRFQSLWKFVASARKMDRLFNPLNEVRNINIALVSSKDMNVKALKAASRTGFLFYWFYDNLVFLSNAKFLLPESDKLAAWKKSSQRAWFSAVVAAMVLSMLNIQAMYQQEAALTKALEAQKEGRSVEVKRQLEQSVKARHKAMVLFVGLLGDFVVSGNNSDFIPKVFGTTLSDQTLGLGGMVSAGVALYYMINPKP